MTAIGTPFSTSATRVLLLGSGELGREVAISLKRLGCEVIACDRYEHAPAMQIADRAYAFPMLDSRRMREIIGREQPHFIVPEIEAIATATLVELENEGFNVVPSANAAHLTMNREGIRRLAAETLNLPTSRYGFADSYDEFYALARQLSFPCFIKPVVSSSGKGQSLVRGEDDLKDAWQHAQSDGRAGAGRVIVESAIDFDYEITLLTVRHRDGTTFCPPIGHHQEGGDYQESWQPQAMSETAWQRAQGVAESVTSALGGYGVFGVELFIKGDDVWFSEVSPRPHDTGMVTMASQTLSQFDLHARAFLGLPIHPVIPIAPAAASAALLVNGHSRDICFENLEVALATPETDLRLFGKPEVAGKRRMGVSLARAETIDDALSKACAVRDQVSATTN